MKNLIELAIEVIRKEKGGYDPELDKERLNMLVSYGKGVASRVIRYSNVLCENISGEDTRAEIQRKWLSKQFEEKSEP